MKLVLSGNEPRQEYLFAQLRETTEVVAEVPFDDIDPVTKYVAAALSYASPREEWWGNYHMHPLIQRRRRKVLSRGMRVLPTRPDALLMWGSWFNPYARPNPGNTRFFNYIDQSRSLKPLPEERPAQFSRRRRSYELQVETYRDSSGILCMSEWARNQTLEAHPAVDTKKVLAVGWGPCGVDLSGEDIPEEKREPVVLHVSNDFYRKGVDFILETAPKVRRAIPDARFLVIGKDSSGMQLTAVEGVEVTGPIRDKKVLSDWFRRASVFFLPHRFDRSPHVLAEAMSAGLPIVTSSQGGPIEVTQGTGVGFLHPIGDTDGYAESLIHILRDRQQRAVMGAKARALMLSRYNWKSVANRIVSVMAT